MSNQKNQIVLLQDIRKRRSERMISKYKEAISVYEEAKKELVKAENNTKLLIEEIEKKRIFLYKFMTENKVDGSVLMSIRASVKFLEEDVEDAIKIERESYVVLKDAENKKNIVKEEYRKLVAACEKIDLMMEML